jgi:hypothetical protein
VDNKRRHQLKGFHHLLNTSEGVDMMEELQRSWAEPNPLDESSSLTGFNIGLGEAYKQLAAWQAGKGLDDG